MGCSLAPSPLHQMFVTLNPRMPAIEDRAHLLLLYVMILLTEAMLAELDALYAASS